MGCDLFEGFEVLFVAISYQASSDGSKGDVGVIWVGVGKCVAGWFVVEIVSWVDGGEQFESREVTQTDQTFEVAIGFEASALGVVDFGEQTDRRYGGRILFKDRQKVGFGFGEFP